MKKKKKTPKPPKTQTRTCQKTHTHTQKPPELPPPLENPTKKDSTQIMQTINTNWMQDSNLVT